jgi:uncharacterized protein YciI
MTADHRQHILALIDVALYNIGRRHDGDDKRLVIAEESLEEAKSLIAAEPQRRMAKITVNRVWLLNAIGWEHESTVDALSEAEKDTVDVDSPLVLDMSKAQKARHFERAAERSADGVKDGGASTSS